MTDLVDMTRLMERGIMKDESDVYPNEIGLCGDEQCGGNCAKCPEAVYNNV